LIQRCSWLSIFAHAHFNKVATKLRLKNEIVRSKSLQGIGLLLKSLKVQLLKAMVIANSPSPLTLLENGDHLSRDKFERLYIVLWLNVNAILRNDYVSSSQNIAVFKKI
jgi:hypothetical protein